MGACASSPAAAAPNGPISDAHASKGSPATAKKLDGSSGTTKPAQVAADNNHVRSTTKTGE